MRLRIRLLLLIVKSLFTSRRSGESVLHFCVLPPDCVIKYMGNDRYHAFMDCGRLDLLFHLTGWSILLKKKYSPFVYTCHIMYRKPLRLFTRFTLRTRLAHIDGYYFWMEHIFEQDGQVMATGISKNGICQSNKLMTTHDVLKRFRGHLDLSSYEDIGKAAISQSEHFLRRIQW